MAIGADYQMQIRRGYFYGERPAGI